MKILVVGAGVIGTIYGWALSEAGHVVVHLLRPGRSSHLANGISIDIMDRRKGHPKWVKGNYPIKVTETLEQAAGYDLIIVPVRHYALVETLRQIRSLVPDADYLLLTQNWQGTAGIEDLLPSSKYIFGDAKAGGSFQGDRLIATLYAIDIGSVDGQQSECLWKAKALFQSADIQTRVQENILHYLWIQYAINGGAWPLAVQAGNFSKLIKDRRLMDIAFLSIKECLAVVASRGVDLQKYPETSLYLTDSLIERKIGFEFMKLIYRYSRYVQRNSAHALADQKEIRTFYDDLVSTGKANGIAMPVMISFKKDMEQLERSKS